MQLCVRQLLFVAMVHDASASMGMIARRLLPQIEQGAKRRLQLGNMNMGSAAKYSAECLAACPTVQDMESQIDQKTMTLAMGQAASMRGAQSTSGDNVDMSAMGDMMADISAAGIGIMCENKPAMMCLAENADVCSGGHTVDMSQQMVMESFDCICSSCPCMQTAVAEMMSLFMKMLASLGQDQEDNTQIMAAACRMTPAFACAQRETATCGRLLSSNASISGESNVMLNLFDGHDANSSDVLEQDPVDMAQMCAELGHTVDVDTCTLPGDDKEQTSGAFAPGLMLIMLAGLVRVV